MPRVTPITNAFNAGELSPRMYGRTDIAKYLAGLKTLLNFNIHPQGGAQRRSGTRHVYEVYDSSKKSRLIRFIFSTTQAYMLEFSEGKVRVFKNEGFTMAPSHDFVDANVNVGADTITISGGHWYEDEQGPFRLTSTGTLPAGLSTGTNYYIKKSSTNAFQLSLTPGGAAVDITGAAGGGTHTIAPYGDVLYEFDIPYDEDEIQDLRFAQSADTLYLVHSSFPPAKVTREDHTEWEYNEIEFQDGPYLDVNTTATTVDPDDVTGTVTLTASSSIFKSTDNGRMFRWFDGANWFWGLLSNYVNGTTIDWTIEGSASMAGHVATALWRFGAWGDEEDLGYPAVVTFNEQRLCFAANTGGPQTLYASKSADYENFAPTTEDPGGAVPSAVADDNGLVYKLAANEVNVIRWINPIRSLIVGTMGGIWPFQATSLLEPITPTNVNTRRSSVVGSADIEPVNVDDLIVAVSFSGRQVFSVGYDYDRDAFMPNDLTLLADHITKSGVIGMAYAREPNNMVYCFRDDGVIAALTFYREQIVAAWGRHVLGGSFGSGNAVVESMDVIPSPDGDPSGVGRDNIAHSQVWMIVKRTINGATYRSIEFIEDPFDHDDVLEDGFFVDCGLTYNDVAADTITGLNHLEGETVQVCADGSHHPDCVVTSGAITLEREASKVHIGLAYESDLGGLRMVLPDPEGTSQGKMRRPIDVSPLFYNTLGGKIGRNEDELEEIIFRSGGDAYDTTPALFSGFNKIKMRPGFDRDGEVFIRQDHPYPMSVLSITYWMRSTDQ